MKRAEIKGSWSYFGCLAHLRREWCDLLIIFDRETKMKTGGEAVHPANYKKRNLGSLQTGEKNFLGRFLL